MTVSFIIPVHNCLDLTRECLRTLEATVPDAQWEAVIVDDCSADGTSDYLATLPARYRILRNETRGSYAINCNRAVAVATGEYLCLLNNDTLLTPGWLEPMRHAFDLFPQAGIVGNIQRNPRTGRYDHMGVVFSPRGLHKHVGKYFFFQPYKGYTEWRAVTGACCLVRATTFRGAGGFDESFVNGCEDVDLCLRLGQQGYRHYVATESVIYHHVSSSPGRRDYNRQNREKFSKRWSANLRAALTPREHRQYYSNAILRALCWPFA